MLLLSPHTLLTSALGSVYAKNNEEKEKEEFQGREHDGKELQSNGNKEERRARGINCSFLNMNQTP